MSEDNQNQETEKDEAAETSAEDSTAEETATDGATADDSPRRNFMVEFAAAAIGAIVGIVPAITGTLFFLDPLLRKKESSDAEDGESSGVDKDEGGYINMGINLGALPEDGSPQLFTVFDDKVDAWNKFLNPPIGSIWLRRDEAGQVKVFNTVCPHLGCSVEYRQGEGDFFCPCHTSAFNLDGDKQNEIPPRGMDKLEFKTKGDDNEIWVKYQNFRAAEKEQIPV